MRVMYVQPAEGFGGAERQGVLHVRQLQALGHEVIPIVGPGRAICDALERDGVRDYIFAPRLLGEEGHPASKLETLANRVRQTADWRWSVSHLLEIARAREVDLVLASRTPGWITASPVARLLRLPLVWRGGSRPVSGRQRHGFRLIARLWRPDLLLCNCMAVRRELAPFVACPTAILANGVDTSRFAPRRGERSLRRRLGIGSDVPVLGFAGRPAPGKGLETLALVVQRALAELPSLRALIAGDYGWRQHYEQLFEARGLAERVTFLSHVTDIERFYASCDVVALAAAERSIEGAPNAILEAMAMKRPVVATRVGGVSELIDDGVEGFLVPPGDPGRFAERVVELLRHRLLRRRMGEYGRRRVLALHEETLVGRRLSSLLEAVAQQTVAPAAHVVAPSYPLAQRASW